MTAPKLQEKSSNVLVHTTFWNILCKNQLTEA